MSRINTATLLACCVPASIVLGVATTSLAGAETIAVVTASVASVSVAWHGPKILLAAAVKVAGAEPDPGTGRRRAQRTEGDMDVRPATAAAEPYGRQEQENAEFAEEYARTAVEQHAPSAARRPDPYIDAPGRTETEAWAEFALTPRAARQAEDLSARGSWDLPYGPASL